MTIKDTYSSMLKACVERGIRFEADGHYQTNIEFGSDPVFVNPDGSDVVRYMFRVNGCNRTRTVNGKTYKYHSDRLPVYGKIVNNDGFRAFLYKYLLFLKVDGIDSKALMMLYLLRCLKDKFEFLKRDKTGQGWEQYEPDYADMKQMVDGILESVMKKEVDDTIRKEFEVRTSCVVKPGMRFKGERMRLMKKGQKMSNQKKIEAVYDASKTDQENADAAGVGIATFKRWKDANVESLEDKIARLYDPSKSNQENADAIGCSVRKIQYYKKNYKTEVTVNPEPVVEQEEDLDGWLNEAFE